MAIVYKCKCCAGSLEVEEGMRLVKCPACRTKQTLPSSRDENIQNLFNRATTQRLKCEFDKAESVYERIIQADEEQYEAYWGLILCKFGVEYVEDPKTETRIPTCHRTSFESIVADENYKLALKYALDDEQKELYKQEAQEIDKIQKGILEVAQNEEPYDVFICYKETDENGKRTQDSVIANDIYHQLTQEGFKVFYAAITLEGKLGSAYEPIIFAALNSAKVMLAVGTKPEYFNAVWVKNEWSRFLKMNKNDRNKLLIPCYRGMDPYDLPEEFAHLQAQDMSKIGFINDIVRGIKKVMEKSADKTTGSANTKNLLKRAYMFLNDGDFESAKMYCDKVLDIDAENSDAYLYGLLVKFHYTTKEKLGSTATDFSSYPEFKRAYQYGNDAQREFLDGCLGKAKAKIRQQKEAEAIEAERRAEEARIAAAKRAEKEKELCEQKRIASVQRNIDEKKEKIKRLERTVKNCRENILHKEHGLKQLFKKATIAKLFAWLHLFSFALCISAIVLLMLASQYADEKTAYIAPFLSVACVFMLATFIPMLMNNPTEQYSYRSALKYVYVMPFLNVVGIMFVVKTFKLTRKRIGKDTDKEIKELRERIPQLNTEIERLKEEIEKLETELK